MCARMATKAAALSIRACQVLLALIAHWFIPFKPDHQILFKKSLHQQQRCVQVHRHDLQHRRLLPFRPNRQTF